MAAIARLWAASQAVLRLKRELGCDYYGMVLYPAFGGEASVQCYSDEMDGVLIAAANSGADYRVERIPGLDRGDWDRLLVDIEGVSFWCEITADDAAALREMLERREQRKAQAAATA